MSWRKVKRLCTAGDSKPIITKGATSKTKVKDYIKSESQKKEEEKRKQQAEDYRKAIQEAQQNQ